MFNPKRKILLLLISFCVAVGIILVLLPQNTKKAVRRTIKRQYLILTGGMIDVGGYRLRIQCQGKGSPTIIMDSGLNMPMDTWQTVPKEVAKFTRVCTYERAGLDESDASPKQLRTSKDVVTDIYTLLQNAGEKGPFVLAGHSFGGLNMLLYSSLHPQDVAGIVLIDSSHPEQYQRYANLKSPEEREKYLRHEGGENREHINLLASAEEVKNALPIPPIPLVILSAEGSNLDPEEVPFVKDHHEMQVDFTRLSPLSKLIIVNNSGHFIQQDRPDIVIDSIQNLCKSSK